MYAFPQVTEMSQQRKCVNSIMLARARVKAMKKHTETALNLEIHKNMQTRMYRLDPLGIYILYIYTHVFRLVY